MRQHPIHRHILYQTRTLSNLAHIAVVDRMDKWMMMGGMAEEGEVHGHTLIFNVM